MSRAPARGEEPPPDAPGLDYAADMAMHRDQSGKTSRTATCADDEPSSLRSSPSPIGAPPRQPGAADDRRIVGTRPGVVKLAPLPQRPQVQVAPEVPTSVSADDSEHETPPHGVAFAPPPLNTRVAESPHAGGQSMIEAMSVKRVPLSSSRRGSRKIMRPPVALSKVIMKREVQIRFWSLVSLCSLLALIQYGTWWGLLEGGQGTCSSAVQTNHQCDCEYAEGSPGFRLWVAYLLFDSWRLPLALLVLLRGVLRKPLGHHPELRRSWFRFCFIVFVVTAAAEGLFPGTHMHYCLLALLLAHRAIKERPEVGYQLVAPIVVFLFFAMIVLAVTGVVVKEAPELLGSSEALLLFPAYIKAWEVLFLRGMRYTVFKATHMDADWTSRHASVIARMGVAVLEGLRTGTLLAAVDDSRDAFYAPFLGSLAVGAFLDILSRNNIWGIVAHRIRGKPMTISDFRCVLHGSKVDTEYVPVAVVALALALPWMPDSDAMGCEGRTIGALQTTVPLLGMIVFFDLVTDFFAYVTHRFVLRVHPSWASVKQVFPRDFTMLLAMFLALITLARDGVLLGVRLAL